MTDSLVGNSDCLKCIGDGEDFVFANCAARYLQAVHLQNKAAELLVDAVTLHHDLYWSSTKTLVTLTCNWVKVMQKLISKGIPLHTILPAFHRAVNLCVEHIRNQALSTSALLQARGPPPSHDLPVGTKDNAVDISRTKVCDACTDNRPGHIEEPCQQFEDQSENRQNESFISAPEDCRTFVDLVQSTTTINNDSSEEDIGWFFDDGKVPDPPDYQKEVVDVTATVRSNYDKPCFASGNNQRGFLPVNPHFLLNDTKSKKSFEPENHLCTRTQNSMKSIHLSDEPDDEFDSCFDDIQHMPTQRAQTVTCTPQSTNSISSQDVHRRSTDKLPSPVIKENSQKDEPHHSEDEYNGGSTEHITQEKCTTIVDLENRGPSKNFADERNISEDSPPLENLSSVSCLPSATCNLEASLHDILNRKKSTTQKKITSRSRHFRTIEDSVLELQENENHSSTITDSLVHVLHNDKLKEAIVDGDEKDASGGGKLINLGSKTVDLEGKMTEFEAMSSYGKPDESNDDLGWFFQEGNESEVPKHRKDVATHSSSTRAHYGIHDPHKVMDIDAKQPDSDVFDLGFLRNIKNPAKRESASKIPQAQQPTRKDSDEFDEFDSCFEGTNYTLGRTQTLSESTETEQKSGVNAVERDSCDGKEVSVSKSSTNAQMTVAQNDIGNHANPTDDASTSTVYASSGGIESKLREILERNKKSAKDSVTTRSRHFRTVEDSIEDLKQKSKSESSQEIDDIMPQKSLRSHERIPCDAVEISLKHKGENLSSSSAAKSEPKLSTMECTESGTVEKSSNICDPKRLEAFVISLSHGASEISGFVRDAFIGQMKACKWPKLRFQTEGLVHTQPCPGLRWERSTLVEGLVVTTTTQQLTLLQRSSPIRNVLLIHGDLRSSYTHKGQQVKQKCVKVTTELGQRSRDEIWLADFTRTIKELGVTCLLASGSVDPSILDLCTSLDILVLSELKYRVLLAVGEASNVEIASYVAECSQENVARDVTLTPYDPDWADHTRQHRGHLLVVLRPQHCIQQTVVICHPSQHLAMHREEQFWHTASRVAHCVDTDLVLPGGGASEWQCAELLQNRAEALRRDAQSAGVDPYTPEIYDAIAEGFQEFESIVVTNSQSEASFSSQSGTSINSQSETRNNSQSDDTIHHDLNTKDIFSTPRVCDDFKSKVEAWQTACHVASQVLLATQEITTGLEKFDKDIDI